MSKLSITKRRHSKLIKEKGEKTRDHKAGDHPNDPDDVEVGYPPPTSPSSIKEEIYNAKDFSQVDKHVRLTSPNLSEDFVSLIGYICRDLESDLAKVRAIFYWIVHQKIPILLNQRDIPPPDTPIGYLHLIRQGKGSYSQLFCTMCRQCDIPCTVIHGLAKNIRYNVGDKLCSKLHSHCWNTVYIEGSWRLVNPHWAAMSVSGYKSGSWTVVDTPDFHKDGNGEGSSKSYIIHPSINDFYFLTDPDKFITKCFPNDPQWQLLSSPLTKQEFEDLPFTQPAFHHLKLQLVGQDKCVLHPDQGKVTVKFKIPEESYMQLQFSYNLFQLRNSNDEGEIDYPQLDRFVLCCRQGMLQLFEIRFPPMSVGVYKLEIKCHDPHRQLLSDWICDFKIMCEQGMEECIPLPIAPKKGWGPSYAMEARGVKAVSHNDGIIQIDDDLYTSFIFEVDKDHDLHSELVHYCKSKAELTDFVECFKNEDENTVVKVKAPCEGEFALQIYCKETGNLEYENVCNYLLQRNIVVEDPNKAKVRERLAKAIEEGDEAILSSCMQDFVEKGLEDRGDLAKAKRQFLLSRINTEIKEAMAARDLDKLERTMHGISDTSLRRELGSIVGDAEQMRSRLRKLKRLKLAILQMDQKLISELRSYPHPPAAVHGVMVATFLLLGQKEGDMKKWSKVQGLISKRGKASLKKRVGNFDGAKVKAKVLQRAKEILQKYDLESVQIASAGAATFYQWATNMIYDIDASHNEGQIE